MMSDDTAFPASSSTPGQTESRKAYKEFIGTLRTYSWWQDYLQLRIEGWDWRKAVFIAWLASPGKDREPDTQEALAQLLGMKSDRQFRNWRRKYPIDDRVSVLLADTLMRHRRDVIDSLVEVASISRAETTPAKKLFFQLTHMLDEKMPSERGTGGDGFENLSDDELDTMIDNLEQRVGDRDEVEEDGEDGE